ncbi:alpha-methylacyl-CoA racemase [Anthonomus grandis grandis]|uniref:alpha-methylacyl-CoA racemase n=1 Tax=Anthonomus grandis grandis TaxID=2921223 RepID=UPI002166733F|nr:alpha-methylacyl-CoA racemase [Anthonomus grandis grandis]
MALKGIKVIEFAGLAPGPFCGMVLADFGASVIKIDRAGGMEEYDSLSNGKRSLCVDLKSPEAITILKKLIQKSDVTLEPYRAGVMEKLGLGPQILMQENPRLIYARLTGYGQSGPYSQKGGHDINYLALSGLLSLFGRKGENPIFPVNLAADFGGGGLMCALGILLALFERERTGRGQIVDANMVHGSSYLGSFLYRSQNMPLIWGNPRGENLLDSGAPFYEVYKTKDDKFMAVGAIERKFYKDLLLGLGVSEDDAPQWDFGDRIKELFKVKFLAKTRQEWCQVFEKLDACVMPVLDLNEAPEHEFNKTNGHFIKVGDIYAPKPAPKLSRTPGQSTADLKRPNAGEHTVEILEEIGYGGSDIDKLIQDGVAYTEHKAKL